VPKGKLIGPAPIPKFHSSEMNSLNQRSRIYEWTIVATFLCGCSSRPTAVRPVDIDPQAASQQAITTYDANGDGALSDEELVKVPGIAKYKGRYDQDKNGTVSQDEIAARLRLWEEQGLGIRQLIVKVTLDGRPLAGADVEFVPEAYLGENVKPARGQTDAEGLTDISVAQEDLPSSLSHLPVAGLTGGTYKVRVTHPRIKLPARYQGDSVLGEEVALDAVFNSSSVQLKSK
jgi:hypothetical protein